MRARNRWFVYPAAALWACALLSAPGIATAADTTDSPSELAGPLYRLVDTAPLTTSRWLQPMSGLRLETAAGLTAAGLSRRHEVRLSATPLPQTWAAYDPLPGGYSSYAGYGLDPSRATYRYTFMERSNWALKVGVSTNVREFTDSFRGTERMRFGALPLMHVAGDARLAQRWRLAFDADGLMTARGRALDIGLRVNYALSHNFSLYGGWRATESSGEAEDFYGSGFSNSANVGVRLRF
jgi:hypothetical protein